MTDKHIISTARKVVLSFIMGGLILLTFASKIDSQIAELLDNRAKAESNMDFRSSREGGNALVKNLSAAVFAPIIFTVPFPTMVSVETQQIQALQNGGWYCKNIMSFFVIYAFILLLKTGDWRKNIIILSFTVGYAITLGLSQYAHAGRFHYPVLPAELILASYGLLHFAKKHRRYFTMFLIFELIVCIAWNWFKLKGRGMV